MTISVFVGEISEDAKPGRRLTEFTEAKVYVRNQKVGRKTIGCSVKFYKPNGDILFEVPFIVPESFELTEDNWPELFRVERSIGIHSRIDNNIVKTSNPIPKSLWFRQRNAGLLLDVKMEGRDTYAMYIVDSNDPSYPVFPGRRVTRIDDEKDSWIVDFTAKNIRLTNPDEGNSVSYILPFKQPMGPEEVLRRWVEYDNNVPSDPAVYITESPSPVKFTAHSFFEFHYFSAFNRKVMFTTQKDASLFALSAIMQHIEQKNDSPSDSLSRFYMLTNDVKRILTGCEEPNKDKLILKFAVELHQYLMTSGNI